MLYRAHAAHESSPRRRDRALSTTEILVTIGLLGLLVGVSFGVLGLTRKGRARATCAANLHSIGVAFNLYLGECGDVYPSPTTTQWEDVLRVYIPRANFRCPADFELFSSLGSSYDWRDTGNPKTTLAGRPAMQVGRGEAALAYDALPGWHAPGTVHVVKVNYEVELVDQGQFFQDLQRSPNR